MNNPDFLFNITPGDVCYDIETYPNVFTLIAKHTVTKQKWTFEISHRRDDSKLLRLWMDTLRDQGCRMVGFFSLGFDYPVIHYIYGYPFASVEDIYVRAMSIINAPFNARFAHIIWDSDQIVPQIDLAKVHHFDNVAKATSLKVLEFNMRMDNIEDLPYPVGTYLNDEQTDELLRYNDHDVLATDLFYDRSEKAITLRDNLSKTLNKNVMNMSDVKIGETLLIMEMEKQGIECYYRDHNNRKQKKQTVRESLNLGEVIFPYVSFELPEFDRLHKWIAEQTITETKGVFDELKTTIEGVEYKLGTGGLHASIQGGVVASTDTCQIVDVDVASFYPNLGIKNRLYPAHLGPEFCDAYLSLYHTRKTFPKKTAENEAYKLALNGAYGGSNNKYSPFFDMKYTMSITINGQLLLCMLVEQMLKIPGLQMIQCNTDGITYLCPREYLDHSRQVCRWWEELTQLELEEALYSRMFIRDVNSYIAEYESEHGKDCPCGCGSKSGKLKRIGAYAYVTAEEDPGTRELPYHKNWSARVVAKAAEAVLVHGADVREFIENHEDVMDFMLRTKVPRDSSLEWGLTKVQNIVRYYISTDGDILEKVMPPKGTAGEYKRANSLTDYYYDTVMAEIGPGVWDERIHTKNKSIYEERRTGIHTGWNVRICNNLEGQTFADINYEWYIQEVDKLIACMI
jgi:hypothetical protein